MNITKLLEKQGYTGYEPIAYKTEKQLKEALMAIFTHQDPKTGYTHKAYANFLKTFRLQIIDAKKAPNLTAACAFDPDNGIRVIRISSGFLDPSIRYQLSVLIRHELAHAALEHFLRSRSYLLQKYGEEGLEAWYQSGIWHNLDNILADFEISNKAYGPEDKKVVQNMVLNGEVIGGLVTEDHRQWQTMSLEQMYAALTLEMKAASDDLKKSGYTNKLDSNDVVTRGLHDAQYSYKYSDLDELDIGHIVHFVDNVKMKMPSGQLGKIYRKLAIAVAEWCKAVDPSLSDIDKKINEFKNTGIDEPYDLVSPSTGEILATAYTPEQKIVLINLLNACNPDPEDRWYTKIRRTIRALELKTGKSFTKEQIVKIIKQVLSNRTI